MVRESLIPHAAPVDAAREPPEPAIPDVKKIAHLKAPQAREVDAGGQPPGNPSRKQSPGATRTGVPANVVPRFAEQLSAALLAKRMTSTELAEASKINERTIRYYRVGTRVPRRLDVIRRLERALDTTFLLPERRTRRGRTKRSAKARKSP